MEEEEEEEKEEEALDSVGNRGGNSRADRHSLRLFDAFEIVVNIQSTHRCSLSLILLIRYKIATCVFVATLSASTIRGLCSYLTYWRSLISGNKVVAQTMEHIHQQSNCLIRRCV